jgi:hypothetical protein
MWKGAGSPIKTFEFDKNTLDGSLALNVQLVVQLLTAVLERRLGRTTRVFRSRVQSRLPYLIQCRVVCNEASAHSHGLLVPTTLYPAANHYHTPRPQTYEECPAHWYVSLRPCSDKY